MSWLEMESLLWRLERYRRLYDDDATVKRLLCVRAAILNILQDKAAGLSETPEADAPVIKCPRCLSTGILAPDKWTKAAQAITRERPVPNVDVDQCPTVSTDLVRRVGLMFESGDVTGKRILCVGDNDLASVLMATVAQPKTITVVENDPRVIRVIQRIAAAKALPIRVVEFDIRKLSSSCFPQLDEHGYDVFETDPPYTEVGMKMFAATGIAALKSEGIGYIVIPHMALEQWSDELLYLTESFLVQCGLVLTAVVPGFETFDHDAKVISSIVRAKKVSRGEKPLLKIESLNPDRFYTTRTRQ